MFQISAISMPVIQGFAVRADFYVFKEGVGRCEGGPVEEIGLGRCGIAVRIDFGSIKENSKVKSCSDSEELSHAEVYSVNQVEFCWLVRTSLTILLSHRRLFNLKSFVAVTV